MTSLTTSAAVDGAELALGGWLPVAATVAATTIASEASQPKTKTAPLRTPRCDVSSRMNVVSGIGSRAMPTAMTKRSRVTGRADRP